MEIWKILWEFEDITSIHGYNWIISLSEIKHSQKYCYSECHVLLSLKHRVYKVKIEDVVSHTIIGMFQENKKENNLLLNSLLIDHD